MVLVEPREGQGPMVRRRGRVKRRMEPKEKGKIQTYFPKIICMKGREETKKKEEVPGQEPARVRKRKVGSGMEDREDGMEPEKAAKVAKSIRDTFKHKLLISTTSSGEDAKSFMGTESSICREGKDDGSKGDNDWIGFGKMKRNARETPEGFEDEYDDNINTQKL